METTRIHLVVEKDGEIKVTGLPCKQGQHVELIMLMGIPSSPGKRSLTAKDLIGSEIVGLWRDRTDISDSACFARQLREDAQNRMKQ